MSKQPYVDRVWQQGPSVSPTALLHDWLDAHPERIVRVPVVLAVADVGVSLRGARIGRVADALVIDVNDAALGIGVAEHARRKGLLLWLEGHFRDGTLYVLWVHDGTPPDHAEIEAAG